MKRRIQQLFTGICLLSLLAAADARAQITVTFDDIAGSVGDTVTVLLSISNVEATSAFSAFQFDVTPNNSNLFFLGILSAGTLSNNPGWSALANDGSHAALPGRVGGFSGTANKIATSGVLVLLQFRIDGTDGGSSVTLEGTRFSLGATVAHTPEIPSAQLVISSPPVATDDSYSVDEGDLLTIGAGTGVLANDTDADMDPLTATVLSDVSNGVLTLATDGSFTYQHDGSETTSDVFTYTASDGGNTDTGSVTITINAINDAPIFTSTMSDVTVNEGAPVFGDYDATDAEGDVLVFAIISAPTGATLDSSTGFLSWIPATAGVYSIEVSVTDGVDTVNAPTATVTVRAVDTYQTTLSGSHLPTIFPTNGIGTISVEHAVLEGTLELSGSFSGLSSSYASAQIGVGSPSEDGTVVFALIATLDSGDPTQGSGSFDSGSNSIDLTTANYPAGIDQASFEASLAAGDVFVVVRSLNALTGELRGQTRTEANTAPSAVTVLGPTAVTIAGDPGDVLYSLNWAGGPIDTEGDEVKLVLETASDNAFSELLEATDLTVTVGLGVDVSNASAAELYDAITGGTPGSIAVGGTTSVFYRLVSTDGNALATGPTLEVAQTRGALTSIDEGSEIPAQFVLRGNYPNPFNPSTTIQFDLPETADVQIDVLDLLGRTMISIPVQSISAGINRSVSIDASALSSGIYVYRVVARTTSETYVSTGTMTLIK